EDVVRRAVSAATKSETALTYDGLTVGIPGVSFKYHSFQVQELFYQFAAGELESMSRKADTLVRQTTCFDLGTCAREAQHSNLAFRLIEALAVIAAIVGFLALMAGVLQGRAPILFAFTALVFIAAFVLVLSIPANAGLGAILLVAPAAYLSLPWSQMDFPLVG